jgi:hypothetical protein
MADMTFAEFAERLAKVSEYVEKMPRLAKSAGDLARKDKGMGDSLDAFAKLIGARMDKELRGLKPLASTLRQAKLERDAKLISRLAIIRKKIQKDIMEILNG